MKPWLLLAGCAALIGACKSPEPSLKSVPFEDDFNRQELGELWKDTGGHWMIRDGQVYTTGGNNAPLFLKVALPDDVVVEVDVHSETRFVDAKIELMTNGKTHQSGYVFILGGWSNTISAICRLDEHGKDRQEKRPTNVSGKRTYRWRIEKKGGDIRWLINGQPYLTFNDPRPLQGKGHDRFAFSNWQNQLRYDNLKIWPYDQAPAASAVEPTPLK